MEVAPWRWRVPPSVRTSPIFWIGFGALLSLSLSWRLFALPMVSDEGGYAYAAERWFDGRGHLYHDLWISRPQAIFVVYGAIIETLGGSTLDLRLVAFAVSVLTMAVVWHLARRWHGAGVAAAATMIFAIMLGSPATEGFTANAEVFMALPAALAIATLVNAYERGWSARWLLATGLLIGVAAQLKPSGITSLGVAIGFIALMAVDTEHFVRFSLRRGGCVLLGFGLSLIPAMYHGYRTGWDEFIYASVTYRLTRQSTATGSFRHHLSAIGDLSERIWPLYVLVGLVFLAQYLTSDARLRAKASPVPIRRSLRPQPALGLVPRYLLLPAGDPMRRLLQIWIVFCLFGISMGGDWWFHYLIQVMAPFAIWLALALAELRKHLPRLAHGALVAVVAGLMVIAYGVITQHSRAEMSYVLFGHPGYADQEVVAEYLHDHTTPETPIFMAFDQAALYYLADRPSSYRYLYDQELRALPESELELIEMVEGPNRPVYIVGTRQLAPFADRGLAFWESVQRHYVLETVVRGVPIYRAISSQPVPGS
jgi:4-amino-4-deoxy-L-arabinose transferase-like glycosyltransferase